MRIIEQNEFESSLNDVLDQSIFRYTVVLEKNPLKSICKLAVFRAERRIIYC